MTKILSPKEFCICIDLDDTLFKEVDFVQSGYKYLIKHLKKSHNIDIKYKLTKNDILNNIDNHIQEFIKKNKINKIRKDFVLKFIRNHAPEIKTTKNVMYKLEIIKKRFKNLILITNGRSITQRNKINKLNLNKFFNDIYISEETGLRKPDIQIYKLIEKKYDKHILIFIGDNLNVDLITPIKMGFKTIFIKNSKYRIHKMELKNSFTRKINLIYENFGNIKVKDILKLI